MFYNYKCDGGPTPISVEIGAVFEYQGGHYYEYFHFWEMEWNNKSSY